MQYIFKVTNLTPNGTHQRKPRYSVESTVYLVCREREKEKTQAQYMTGPMEAQTAGRRTRGVSCHPRRGAR